MNTPRWDDREGRALAFTLAGTSPGEPPLHVLLNMHDRALEFALPAIPGQAWHLAVDTAATPALYPRPEASPRPNPAAAGSRAIL